MSVHDIGSNFKISGLFTGGQKTAAVTNTIPVDLSLGTTAMLFISIYGSGVLAGQNLLTAIIQYADDIAFTQNVVTDPVNSEGISELGNSFYKIDFPNQVAGEKAPLLIPLLPLDFSGPDFVMFVANVVNPFNGPAGSRTRYCRLQMTFEDTLPQRITGMGFVGPVRYKLPNGENA